MTEFKGGTSNEGTGLPPSDPLPLHASASIGDFIVIAGAGISVTDPRFTLVGVSETWTGPATTLDDIEYVSTGFHWAIAAAVFTPAQIGGSNSASGSTNPGVLPQVQSLGIVIASLTGSTGALGAPEGFTAAVDRNQGVAFVSISYMHVTGLSPAAEFTTGGAFWAALVLTARTISPPMRRYPRADGRGVGPKRHYPPPESRRRVGGYY